MKFAGVLSTLRYPAGQMLVIGGGNIEGQSFTFDERIAEEATWLHQLRTGGTHAEWFARNGPRLGASNSVGYWLILLQLLKNVRPRLAGLLDGTAPVGAPRSPLAVFPLQGTSVLVLSRNVLNRTINKGTPQRWPDLNWNGGMVSTEICSNWLVRKILTGPTESSQGLRRCRW